MKNDRSGLNSQNGLIHLCIFVTDIRADDKLSIHLCDVIFEWFSLIFGNSLCLLFPFIIGSDKAIMHDLLYFHPCLDGIIQGSYSSYIKSFPLKSNSNTVFPILQTEHTPEPALIIAAVLSFLDCLQACAVYKMKLLRNFIPDFLFSIASAAPVISVYKVILCHINLIPAAAPAVPVYGALFIPSLDRIFSRESSECLARYICHPLVFQVLQASATLALSIL